MDIQGIEKYLWDHCPPPPLTSYIVVTEDWTIAFLENMFLSVTTDKTGAGNTD